MGFLKDLSKWLSGGKGKKDNIRQAAIKLKVFNKRLLRQSKKMELMGKQARDKAVKLRREGDMEGSRFHARTYLQFSNQARAVDTFRTNLESLQFKLEQAQAIQDFTGVFKGISQSLSALKNQLNLPEIDQMMKEMDVDMSDFEIASEITTEGMQNANLDYSVTDSAVDTILGEIDAEIGVETGAALPDAVSDEKIKELEDELKKLKSD